MKRHLRDFMPDQILGFTRRVRGLRHLPNKGMQEFERLGIKWRVPGESCVAQGMYHDAWEVELREFAMQTIKPGWNVLDVGANFGYFTMQFAQLVGNSGRVSAFEPVPYWREMLLWHVRTNEARNVTVFDYGLSNAQERHGIRVDSDSATMHGGTPNESIQLRRLDDVWGELGMTRLDFIKIDTDGHEPFFLQGARETLSRFQPIIALEFSPHNLINSNSTPEYQRELLLELGYCLYTEEGKEMDEATFKELASHPQGLGFNAVAKPNQESK